MRDLDPDEVETLARASEILERLLDDGLGETYVTAALRRSFSSLEIPNYRRYFAGQIVSLSGNWMQMVAEMWLILELTGSGVAVGVTAALQFLPILVLRRLGRRARRPLAEALAARRHPDRDGRPRARALGADRDRRGRALDGLRARLRPRRR